MAVEHGLAELPGVETVAVDLEAVTVRYDPAAVGLDALSRRIEEMGFQVVDGSVPVAGPRRPLIPAPVVVGGIALLGLLAVVFRDRVAYMGGINTLFTPGGLNEETFDQASLVAVGVAFVVGVAVFFSPGILAITSVITGYVAGSAETSRRETLRVASGFAVGLVVMDAALGALFALGGKAAIRFFGDNLATWNLLIAVVLLAVGLMLLRVWTLELPALLPKVSNVRGFRGALLVTVPFGLLDCPACTPLLLPVALGAAATGDPLYGAAVMGAYGLGRGVLLMGVGFSAGLLKQFRTGSRYLPLLETMGGLLLVLGGLYFFKEFLRLTSIIGL